MKDPPSGQNANTDAAAGYVTAQPGSAYYDGVLHCAVKPETKYVFLRATARCGYSFHQWKGNCKIYRLKKGGESVNLDTGADLAKHDRPVGEASIGVVIEQDDKIKGKTLEAIFAPSGSCDEKGLDGNNLFRRLAKAELGSDEVIAMAYHESLHKLNQYTCGRLPIVTPVTTPTSTSWAVGIMQIIPRWHPEYFNDYWNPSPNNLSWDEKYNISCGKGYFDELKEIVINRFKNALNYVEGQKMPDEININTDIGKYHILMETWACYKEGQETWRYWNKEKLKGDDPEWVPLGGPGCVYSDLVYPIYQTKPWDSLTDCSPCNQCP